MKFRQVAARAANEDGFMREIQEVANRAGADGVGSEAWIELASYFAENEEELRLLTPSLVDAVPGQLNTDTNTTTLLGTQTGITWTTTTTTTTSRLCTIPGICPQAEAAPQRAQDGGDQEADA